MIDWDHDGDIDAEDIGLSAMMLDDLSAKDQERRKYKKGCLGGCLGTAVVGLALVGTLGCIITVIVM